VLLTRPRLVSQAAFRLYERSGEHRHSSCFINHGYKADNPFPIGSKLRLSVLLDSAKVAPILNELQAKYRGDRSEKRRPFSPSKPILLSIFHLLPSENYDLYRSSLSRLVQEGSRFPVTIERPFATKSTLLASFGFNIRSPEIEALRNELAKDFKDYMEYQLYRYQKDSWPNRHNSNVNFRPKIMFMHRVARDMVEQIEREPKKKFPGTVATSTALGLMLIESRKITTPETIYELAEEKFLFQN